MEDDLLASEFTDEAFRRSIVQFIKESGEPFEEDFSGWSQDRYASNCIGKSVRAGQVGKALGRPRHKLEGE